MHAFFDRFSAIPGLLITSSVCYTLLALHLSHYRGSERVAEWTRTHQTLVAVIVQILSHAFGVTHVHIICALVRSSFLVTISTKPFRLHTVHFIQAATAPMMTWSMSWKYTAFLSTIVASSLLPAPLWAAAMAPLLTTQELKSSIDISSFKVANASAMWDGDLSTSTFGKGGSAQWLTPQGLFTFDRQGYKPLQGSLISSASGASVAINGSTSHAKLDKTGFIYEGRSYGAGADAGFTEIRDFNAPHSYRYTEQSFQSSVSCFYNESMTWQPYLVDGDLPMSMWQFTGDAPNGEDTPIFFTYIAWTRNNTFAWWAVYNTPERKIQVQVNTGDDPTNPTDDGVTYGQFAKIQCDISLEEQNIDVLVNTTEKLIKTKPVDAPPLGWPEYGKEVALTITSSLYYLSEADSGSGNIGGGLILNVNQLLNQTNDKSNATTLRGTETFFASLVDDIIVLLRQTRRVSHAPQATEQTTALVTVSAIVFGAKKFVWILGVLNFIIIVAYAFEIIRTRAWKSIPPLDIMNDSQVIMAAFEGGQVLEREYEGNDGHRKRVSDDSLLRLQYEGLTSKRLLFMPHLPDDESDVAPGRQSLMEDVSTSGAEDRLYRNGR